MDAIIDEMAEAFPALGQGRLTREQVAKLIKKWRDAISDGFVVEGQPEFNQFWGDLLALQPAKVSKKALVDVISQKHATWERKAQAVADYLGLEVEE